MAAAPPQGAQYMEPAEAALPQGCCGCCWGRCPRFSYVSTAFLASTAITMLVLVLVSAENLLLLPLVALSPALVVWLAYWRVLRKVLGDAADDDLFLRMFAGGCLPATLFASLLEFLLGLFFFFVCFGGQVSAYVDDVAKHEGEPDYVAPDLTLRRDFAFVANIALNAFITAALVEEALKAAMVRCQGCCGPERSCCLQRPHPDPKKQAYMTISLLLAASVGFSTMENVIYVLSSDVGDSGVLGFRVLLAIVRGAISLPVHAICGAFTGLRLTIRDVQRRHRDSAVLASQSQGGAPSLVMLPSGVVVQVVTVPADQQAQAQQHIAQQQRALAVAQAQGTVNVPAILNNLYAGATAGHGMPLPPPQPLASAPLQPLGFVAPAAEAARAGDAARQVVVWSWLRVLWPAVVIHGSFDFLLMIFDGFIPNVGGSIAAAIVAALTIVFASGWALRSQLDAALAVVARGRIPERVTCAPVWWPRWLRALATAPGAEALDDSEGYAPFRNGEAAEAMLGSGSVGRGGPRSGEELDDGLLQSGVTALDLRMVTDGQSVVSVRSPQPTAPAAVPAEGTPAGAVASTAALHPALGGPSREAAASGAAK